MKSFDQVLEERKLKKESNGVDMSKFNAAMSNRAQSKLSEMYNDSLFDSVTDYRKRAESDYGGIGYGNAGHLYRKYSTDAATITDRTKATRDYINSNKSYLSAFDTDSILKSLDTIDEHVTGISSAYKNQSDFISTFKTEDDYNAYLEELKKEDELAALDVDKLKRDAEYFEWTYKRTKELTDEAQEINGQLRGYEASKTKDGGFLTEGDERAYYGLKGRLKAIDQELRDLGAAVDGETKTYSDQLGVKQKWNDAQSLYRKAKTVQDNRRVSGYLEGVNDPSSPNYDPDYATYVKQGESGEKPTHFEYKLVEPYMSQDQIDNYNYIYEKYGRHDSDVYLEIIRKQTEYDRSKEFYEKYLEDNTLGEIMYSAAVGLDQFATGVEAVLGIDNSDKSLFDPQIVGAMAREDLGDDSLKLWYNFNTGEWEDTIFGSSVGQAAYDFGSTMSNMAPSLGVGALVSMVNPAAGAVVTTSMFGASAGGNAYKDALNRGYTEDQAKMYGVLVGGSEALLQYAIGGISKAGGKLTNNAISKMVSGIDNAYARVALQLGGNMLAEGFEEGLQEILTPFFENIALNADNDWSDIDWEQVAYSYLLGSLSSLGMEGTGTAINAGKNIVQHNKALKLQGQQIINDGGVDALKAVGIEYGTELGDKKGAKLAKQANAISNVSGAKAIGAFSENVNKARVKLNKGEIETALINKGLDKKTAKNYTNVLVAMNEDYFNGISSKLELGTEQQWQKLTGNKGAYSVLKAVVSNADYKANLRNAKMSNAMLGIRTDENGQAVEEDVDKFVSKKVVEAESKSLTAENHFDISTDGKTINTKTGDVINVAEISSINDGEMTLKLDNGDTVNASDVIFATEDEGIIYSAVLDMGINAAEANLFVNEYKHSKGISAQKYALGIQEAYRYGKYSIPMREMSSNGFSALLTAKQRTDAYKLGQSDAKASAEAMQKAIDEAKKDSNTKESEKGKVHFEGDRGNLTDLQKTSLETLDKLAESLGVSFYIYESRVENGKRVYTDMDGKVKPAPNGKYYRDGSIHIDLNAGIDGKGTILFTAAHELTHYIKQWSPAKFKVLADFLMKQYGKAGISVDTLVQQQIDKAKRNGRTIDYDTAFEEVVADSMESMLTDGKVAEKLALLKKQDKGLVNKIKQFFAELAKKIQAVYKGLNPNSQEGRYVAEMKDAVDKIQSLFTEALVDASESYQLAREANNGEGDTVLPDGTKYSKRLSFAEQVDDVIAGKFERANAVYVCETPQNLSAVGLNQSLPMLTTARHIRLASLPKNTYKHQHGLTEAQIKSLPEKIADPVMIMDSLDEDSNSIVVVTDMLDVDRSPVIATIKADGKGMFNNVEVDTNFLTSYYGRDGFALFIENNVSADTLLFINKEKATTLAAESSTSWLEQLKGYDFDVIIRQTRSVVKRDVKKSSHRDSTGRELTEAQQEFFKDSKARDKDGNLQVVYHGTRIADFTVFKRNVNYFTDSKEMADSYSPNGDMYEGYVNITKPYEIDAAGEKWSSVPIDDSMKALLEQYGSSVFKENGKWRTTPADIASAIEEAVDNGELDYDGIIIKNIDDTGSYYKDEGKHLATDYIVFASNQFKNVDNTNPTADPDIRYSDRYDETIARAKEHFGTTTDFEEAGFILPNGEMLKFTDDSHKGERQYDHRAIGIAYGENVDLNVNHGFNEESEKHLVDFVDNGGIRFDPGSFELDMDAGLQMSDSVPITAAQERTIRDFVEWKKQQEEMHINDNDDMSLYSGSFALHVDFGANANIAVSASAKDLDAWGVKHLSYEGGQINADRIIADIRHYYRTGETRKNSTVAQFRYQDRDVEQEKAYQKVTKQLSKENAKLREDLTYLKELLKLQGKVTDGKMLSKTSLQAVAKRLMTYSRAKGEVTELVGHLNDVYSYILSGEDVSWEGVAEKATGAIDWLMDHEQKITKRDEYSDMILKELRTKRVKLNDVQKAEAIAAYGSLREFRNKVMGSIIIANDGVPLDSAWSDLSKAYAAYFDPDMSDANQAVGLVEAIEALRTTEVEEGYYEYEQDMVAQDLLTKVYDSYWDVATLHTVADAKQKQINLLKSKHKQQMDALRKSHMDKDAEMRKAHREEVSNIRKEYRDRAEAKLKKQAERYQESRKKAVESRQKTVLKQSIKRVVNRLNSLLNKGNKERNVKNGLRDTVASALDAAEILFNTNITNDDIVRNGIDFATGDDVARLDEYRELLDSRDAIIAKIDSITQNEKPADSFEKIEALYADIDKIDAKISNLGKGLSKLFAMERARINNATVSSAIDKIAEAYESIKESEDKYIKASYDEYVAKRLSALRKDIGGTIIKDMSVAQMRELLDAFTMIAHTVANANTYFRNGKAEVLAKRVSAVQEQIMAHYKKLKNDPRSGINNVADLLKGIAWNEMKPLAAFETIGSDAFTELFWDVIQAEGKWAKFMEDAEGFLDAQRKKYGYKSWDMESAQEFTLPDGKVFKLTLQDMMSIYAYSKREQAYEHMTEGGFQFAEHSEYKDGKVKRIHLTGDLYATDLATINKIVAALGKVDDGKVIKYVDAVQSYLTDLGKKGNEVSRVLYGIDIFNETAYFPLMSAKDFRSSVETALNNTQTQVSLKNTGMTKATVPHAKNPIILQGFDEVAINHIKKMADYTTQVLPIENLRRVFDSVSLADEGGSVATKAIIKKVFGASAEKYIDQYITDLNGGSMADGAKSPTWSMFSKFKATAVGASLSVVVQQPFAVIRAMEEISPKHFLFGQAGKSETTHLYDEIKKYAPVAVIKEMGGFDTGSNRTAQDYLGVRTDKGVKRVLDEVSDKSTWLAGKADELGWNIIWLAVKREVNASKKYKFGSQEFYEACGKRFTEVVVRTQVYDSVNSRSGYMRSKSELTKFATSFMGEPTAIVNEAYLSILNVVRATDGVARKKALKKLLRTMGVLSTSAVLTTLAKSFIYAMRDDDEDDVALLERWSYQFGDNLRSEVNPLTLLPYAKDLVSLWEGWDVERPDMTLFANIITSTKKMIDDGATAEEVIAFMGDTANIFGIPAKNLVRDGKGIVNLFGDIFDDVTPQNMGGAFASGWRDEKYTEKTRAENAFEKGDTREVKRIVDKMVEEKYNKYLEDGEKKDKAKSQATSAVRSSFTSTYKKQYLEAYEKRDRDEMNRIRKLLYATGLYGTLSELDEDLEKWRKAD